MALSVFTLWFKLYEFVVCTFWMLPAQMILFSIKSLTCWLNLNAQILHRPFHGIRFGEMGSCFLPFSLVTMSFLWCVETRTCPVGYFLCNNGRCIDRIKKCDLNHTDDCGDFSDEKSCGCQKNEFLCVSDGSCILASFHCDHDKDCPDASDEIGCPKTNCSYLANSNLEIEKLIMCNTTTACILPAWVCDGHDDCWDNSDEVNCSKFPSAWLLHAWCMNVFGLLKIESFVLKLCFILLYDHDKMIMIGITVVC